MQKEVRGDCEIILNENVLLVYEPTDCWDVDKEPQCRGGDSHEEKWEDIDGCFLRVAKWYDNRAGALISTFSSAPTLGQVK